MTAIEKIEEEILNLDRELNAGIEGEAKEAMAWGAYDALVWAHAILLDEQKALACLKAFEPLKDLEKLVGKAD